MSVAISECPLCRVEAHAGARAQAHARGNPDGGPTAEELKRRIHHNLVRLLMIGGDCPLKYLIQLREDLELWEKYEAAGLVPPVAEELIVQAP